MLHHKSVSRSNLAEKFAGETCESLLRFGKIRPNPVLKSHKENLNPCSFDMLWDDHHSNLRKQCNSCHKNSPAFLQLMLEPGFHGPFSDPKTRIPAGSKARSSLKWTVLGQSGRSEGLKWTVRRSESGRS